MSLGERLNAAIKAQGISQKEFAKKTNITEYIDRKHFDERVRIAVGMSEGDMTKDFKDGVLFVLEMLKTEDKANTIDIPEGATNGDVIKAMFPNCEQKEHMNNGYFEMYFDNDIRNASYMRVHKYWWREPYQNGVSK